jgi:hypothetical protein
LRLLDDLEAASGEIEMFAVGPEGEARHQLALTAPRRPRELADRFERAIDQAHQLTLMLTHGFVGRVRAAPEGGAYCEWDPSLTRHEAGTYSMRIFVMVLMPELEHFLREFAHWWLTPERCKKLRKKHPGMSRRRLARLTKPSAKKWFVPRLSRVFGVKVPEPLRVGFRTLLHWRNEFAHRNNPPGFIDWTYDHDFFESSFTWHLAAIGLCNMLVSRWQER